MAHRAIIKGRWDKAVSGRRGGRAECKLWSVGHSQARLLLLLLTEVWHASLQSDHISFQCVKQPRATVRRDDEVVEWQPKILCGVIQMVTVTGYDITVDICLHLTHKNGRKTFPLNHKHPKYSRGWLEKEAWEKEGENLCVSFNFLFTFYVEGTNYFLKCLAERGV